MSNESPTNIKKVENLFISILSKYILFLKSYSCFYSFFNKFIFFLLFIFFVVSCAHRYPIQQDILINRVSSQFRLKLLCDVVQNFPSDSEGNSKKSSTI